jgi:hypothetical protein
MRTLKASLLASVSGTGAWLLGVPAKIWPAHPWWAVFFITIGATVLLNYILPEPDETVTKQRNNP